MAKSIIIIEEETTKDENGKTLLKRTVSANILNAQKILYQDTITPKELHNEDTPLNLFERWAVMLHENSFILENE